MRRATLFIGLLCLSASLAACSVSVTGGLIGGVLTVLVGVGLLAFGGATQSGCGMIGPCLSPIPPPEEAGAASAQPASKAAQPASKAATASKAAQPPSAPAQPADAGVASVQPRDAGTARPIAPPSRAPKTEPAMPVCLSEMPPGICLSEFLRPHGLLDGPATPALDRDAIKARLVAEGALPADVIDRLT